MTPDTCPFCDAAKYRDVHGQRWFSCLTTATDRSTQQSPECARYVRTRISQLRRMAHTAWLRAAHHPRALVNGRRKRYNRFAAACLREIDRLRGTP